MSAARARRLVVYAIVLMAATAGLGYELALGTAESFLLGDPVVQFALIVGIYMMALGVGAWVSGWIRRALPARCVDVMLATALLGGGGVPILMVVFALQGPFRPVLWTLAAAIGVLGGIQLPLLMRVLREQERFEDVVARGFAVDYAGALLGSLGFSLVLMPWVGLVRASLLLGLINALAAACVAAVLGDKTRGRRMRVGLSAAVAGVLIALIVLAARIEGMAEAAA